MVHRWLHSPALVICLDHLQRGDAPGTCDNADIGSSESVESAAGGLGVW